MPACDISGLYDMDSLGFLGTDNFAFLGGYTSGTYTGGKCFLLPVSADFEIVGCLNFFHSHFGFNFYFLPY